MGFSSWSAKDFAILSAALAFAFFAIYNKHKDKNPSISGVVGSQTELSNGGEAQGILENEIQSSPSAITDGSDESQIMNRRGELLSSLSACYKREEQKKGYALASMSFTYPTSRVETERQIASIQRYLTDCQSRENMAGQRLNELKSQLDQKRQSVHDLYNEINDCNRQVASNLGRSPSNSGVAFYRLDNNASAQDFEREISAADEEKSVALNQLAICRSQLAGLTDLHRSNAYGGGVR